MEFWAFQMFVSFRVLLEKKSKSGTTPDKKPSFLCLRVRIQMSQQRRIRHELVEPACLFVHGVAWRLSLPQPFERSHDSMSRPCIDWKEAAIESMQGLGMDS
jgi:hypothetical protein